MADAPETGNEQEAGTETAPTPQTEETKHERLPDDHPAALALKAANKEAETLRLKVKEFEDADKSELEKATNAAADAVKRAEEAELKVLRLEVAGDKGLTPTQARRLVGTTKEELEADADQLLEDFAANSKPTPKVPPRPKPPAGSKDTDGTGGLEGKERAAAALRQMKTTR